MKYKIIDSGQRVLFSKELNNELDLIIAESKFRMSVYRIRDTIETMDNHLENLDGQETMQTLRRCYNHLKTFGFLTQEIRDLSSIAEMIFEISECLSGDQDPDKIYRINFKTMEVNRNNLVKKGFKCTFISNFMEEIQASQFIHKLYVAAKEFNKGPDDDSSSRNSDNLSTALAATSALSVALLKVRKGRNTIYNYSYPDPHSNS